MIYQKTTDMVQIKKCTFEHITKSYPCKEKSVLDGCMIMRQSIKPEDVQSPFQVEAYALLFCISGEVNIISDLRSYTVTPGTLFVYLPNNIIKIDCKKERIISEVILASDYLRKNFLQWNKISPLFIQTTNNPVITIPTNRRDELIRMLDNIQERIKTATCSEWNRKAYHAALKTFLYDIISLANNPEFLEITNIHQSRNQDYFARFMQLVSQYCKKERKVHFYASKLCISSKYLSTIIKEVSGKTPSRWIDEVIMSEAIFLLKYSNATVQEIAFQMNFPNPSFFGKFFKRYTGFSPKTYRNNATLTIS